MQDTLWQRLFCGVRRLRQQPEWERYAGADWAEYVMQVAIRDDFHAKQGRSTGRWVLQCGERQLAVYLKRHNRLPWWRGLLAAFWPNAGWSPASQEWRHLEWARTCGLPVPDAVAAAEYIGPWGRLRSFLAVKELAGMLPLHRAIPAAARLLDPDAFARWKRALVAELARLTRVLHDRRWFHKDLYLCHFYIPEDGIRTLSDWLGRVHLIDFHRLQRHHWTWRLWQAKDLAQLLYSSEIVGISARDRLRFWRLYLGFERRSRVAKWLQGAVLWKWRRYRRHNRNKTPVAAKGGDSSG